MALEGEHDNDGVDEAQQRDRAEVGHEVVLEAALSNRGQEGVAGDDAGQQRDAQEEQHAARDLPEANVHSPGRARAARNHLEMRMRTRINGAGRTGGTKRACL